MNQQLYDQLIDAGKVLIKRDEEIERCAKLRTQIATRKLAIQDVLEKKKITYKGRLIPGLIMTILWFLPAMVCLLGIGASESFGEWLSVFMFFGLPFVIGLLLLVSIPISKYVHVQKVEKEYLEIKERNEEAISLLESEILKIQEDLKEYLRQNQHKLSFIPEDYQDIQAVSFMIRVVHNLRADSLKEALNLYDLELKHQQTLAVAEQQRAQNENLMAAIKMVNARQEQINDKQSKTNAMLTGMIVADIIEDLFD